jgi:hypothetical protein
MNSQKEENISNFKRHVEMSLQPPEKHTQIYVEMSPQPPERYTQIYEERRSDGSAEWLWSEETSGEGAEQQDLYSLEHKQIYSIGDNLFDKVIIKIDVIKNDILWFWEYTLSSLKNQVIAKPPGFIMEDNNTQISISGGSKESSEQKPGKMMNNKMLYESLTHELKSDVNEFLFCRVPETMTIKQFEQLSVKIHNMILSTFEENIENEE